MTVKHLFQLLGLGSLLAIIAEWYALLSILWVFGGVTFVAAFLHTVVDRWILGTGPCGRDDDLDRPT